MSLRAVARLVRVYKSSVATIRGILAETVQARHEQALDVMRENALRGLASEMQTYHLGAEFDRLAMTKSEDVEGLRVRARQLTSVAVQVTGKYWRPVDAHGAVAVARVLNLTVR